MLLLAAFGATSVHAQQNVSGTVTDADTGQPLPGVNISVQGTTTGTTTALDGTYTITVPGSDAVLVFSFIGFQRREVAVGDRDVIDVALSEDVVGLEDVVVVGYGTQRREDVTGSVATVDVEDANQGLVTSPTQMLQGRVAGVNITQNNGEPGAGFNVRIRGGTSISASNEPLYVVDGVPIDNVDVTPSGTGGFGGEAAPNRNPLSMLNPNDIASISILKDASATAIYGSRGANGVVLIETKGGNATETTIDYEGYVTAATPSRQLDVLSGSEYRNFIAGQVQAGNLSQSRLDGLGSANTDWEDEITQTALTHFHNLAMSGGNQATQYRASLSYMNQEGVVISSGLERVTGRINADHAAFDDDLRLALNLSSTYQNDDYVLYESTAGFEGGLFTNTFDFDPTRPVQANGDYYEIGTGTQGVRNPVGVAEEIDDDSKTTRTLGNLSAEYDLIESLTAKVNVGADRAVSSRRAFFPRSSPIGAAFDGRAVQKDREHTSYTLQSYVTYNDQLADVHSVNVLGGYEFNEYLTEEFGAEARGFVSDQLGSDALEAGTPYQPGTYSDKLKSRLISFFTRLNYNFDSRYYLTGVLRYDGSSRFGAGNKWALFPALSGAWRISEESFMRGVDAVSDLRLKAGYGIVGSQEIPPYRSLALLAADPDNAAVIGNQRRSGVAPSQYQNENLKWEETTSFNVGLDYGFLNGKYSGSLEFYRKDTDDLLLEVVVPQPAVVERRLENIGSVQNQGFEFSLDALVIDRKDFSLMLGGVFNANRNEVVNLGERDQIAIGVVQGRGQSDTRSQMIIPGEPLYTFYGPEFSHVGDDGRQYFVNYNANGEADGVVLAADLGDEDRQILGDAQPDFGYGFRTNLYWGNFDMTLFLRGEYGRKLLNNTALVYQTKSAVNQNKNFLKEALDDPDAIDEPAVFSSRWVQDASFLRLDNLTFGYTLDISQMTTYGRSARVYLSMQNLFVLTPYSGYDPELNTATTFNGINSVGIDYLNYPQPRTFTLGVSLGM